MKICILLVESALEGVRIVRIACGASHSLAVSEDGQVFGWGKNTQGQCGVGMCTIHAPIR